MKQFDEQRPAFSSYGFACELWVPKCMPRPDQHNEIEINWLESGSLTYLLGGNRTTIKPRTLAIFWAAVPHQIVEFETEEPYYVVTLPLTEFLQTGIDRTIVNRILLGELLIDPTMNEFEGTWFARWDADLRSLSQIRVRAAQLEVRARLLRMSNNVSSTTTSATPLKLSRADQLACFIAKNYQQPLTSDLIADANGLHPNYAMNLFRKAFGTTMTAFTIQHRLSHAQRLLVTTNDSILTVAFESGFQSLTRFNEVFRQACGCSPREFRKSHQ